MTPNQPIEMVTIAVYSNLQRAHLGRGFLEQAGILCRVLGELHHLHQGGRMFKMLVPRKHEDEAIELLEHVKQPLLTR